MPEKKTILIVEDEKSIREALKEKLENNDFSVLVANNGQEGLDLALQKHPDLIILDIIMPVMSGIQMIEKLKEDIWGENVRIIILTNMMDTGKLPKASVNSKGVYKYIVKTDIKIEELVKQIREMF